MYTLANRITILRIAFVPVFVFLMLSKLPGKQYLAAATFGLIASTDGLDGYVARTYNQVTEFGKTLDPLADKILIITALITLVKVAQLPIWVVVVIIIREVLITLLRMMAGKKGIVISASKMGKSKTIFQIAAIIFWIFNTKEALVSIYYISWILILIALILSLLSAMNYLMKFREVWE